jgi:hypothetical protein
MNYQAKFEAFDRDQKIRFLFNCIQENEKFLSTWSANNSSLLIIEKPKNLGIFSIFKNLFSKPSPQNEDFISVSTSKDVEAFNTIRKLIYPKINEEEIIKNENNLEKIANEVDLIANNLADADLANSTRALACYIALECFLTLLVDFKSITTDESYDMDDIGFQIILLSALGNTLNKKFDELVPEIAYTYKWADINTLFKENPNLDKIFEGFICSMFEKA